MRGDDIETMAKMAMLGGFTAVALVAYTTLVVPSQREEARMALAHAGYRDAVLQDAPGTFCGKNRTGFLWRTQRVRGKVCVGGFMGPDVSVWR